MILRELFENNEPTGVIKVSCYSLVHVRAELTFCLYDKLVFILEQIYIYYGTNVSYEWDGRGNHGRKGAARVNLFGMVKETILWGLGDYNIRNSVMCQL